MDNLMELDLSFNKITQLTKTTFAKLKELYNLNLSDNFIKKFNPQFLAPLTQLITLRVDKFTTYKNLETLFVKLPAIGLSTKTWSCNYVQNVTRALNSQKLLIDFNNFDTYRPSFEGYTCLLNMTTLNQIKKKIGIWDMIRM